MKNGKLIIVDGLPGTGKTYLGTQIAKFLDIPFISKDIYKELLFESLGVGDVEWSQKMGRASFDLLFNIADQHLSFLGQCLIETHFNFEYSPPKILELISDKEIKLIYMYLKCDEDVRLHRIEKRISSGERHPGHCDTERLKVKDPSRLPSSNHLQGLGVEPLIVDSTHFEKLDLNSILDYCKLSR